MTEVKVGEDGSLGIVLSDALLARMGWKAGDGVVCLELTDGFLVRPEGPSHEEHLEAARRVMERRREVLGKLSE